MKKTSLYVLTLIGIFAILATPFFAHAQGSAPRYGKDYTPPNFLNDQLGIPTTGGQSPTSNSNSNSSGTLDIPGIINRIGKWLFDILMAVAVVMILVGALMYVFSGGSAEKVQTANKMIVYAVIGVAIALLSKVVVATVQYFVGR